jgi:transcriptional antiterminator
MSKKKLYKISKVLNNNVILANDLINNKELVLVGKGIGFGHKTEEEVEIDPDKIDKFFINYDEKSKNEFIQLINELDTKAMGISEEIIALAEKKLSKLNPHIHIALTDHISFTLERLKKGMLINNPFTEEIKILYPDEYKVGIKAAEMIKKRLDIEIPVSEIGFIAMHLHAACQNKKVSETVKYTNFLKEIVHILEHELDIKLDPGDLNYKRLITHLRFSLDRLEKGKFIQNPLLDKIKSEFYGSYLIAKKIGKKIEDELRLKIDEDELGYLSIHIQRLNNI